MNKKIVGCYHQTDNIIFPIDLYMPPYNGCFQKGEFLDFDPEIKIMLHRKAKITDFIDGRTLGFGIIVNEKVKIILESFNLPPHKYHPIELFQEDIKYLGYHWLHFFVDLYNFIDVKKSLFEVIDENEQEVILIDNIKSDNQMCSIFKKYKYPNYINIKALYFDSKMPNYDLFSDNIGKDYNYMSERLVDYINENNITGLDFKEAIKLYFEK